MNNTRHDGKDIKSIRQKLLNYEVEPSPEAWNKIAQKSGVKKDCFARYKKYGIAAVGVALTIFLWFWQASTVVDKASVPRSPQNAPDTLSKPMIKQEINKNTDISIDSLPIDKAIVRPIPKNEITPRQSEKKVNIKISPKVLTKDTLGQKKDIIDCKATPTRPLVHLAPSIERITLSDMPLAELTKENTELSKLETLKENILEREVALPIGKIKVGKKLKGFIRLAENFLDEGMTVNVGLKNVPHKTNIKSS